MAADNDKNYPFPTVEYAVKLLKLDRRHKWKNLTVNWYIHIVTRQLAVVAVVIVRMDMGVAMVIVDAVNVDTLARG